MLNHQRKNVSEKPLTVLCVLTFFLITLSSCSLKSNPHPINPKAAVEIFDGTLVKLLESGKVSLAKEAPVLMTKDNSAVGDSSLNSKTITHFHSTTSRSSPYIHFSDPDSCLWNPNICNNSFAVWPGYIQNMGGSTWGYVWMSHGPGGELIPHGTSKHYHIVGMFDPSVEPNPKHSAMFGNEWLAVVMKKNGSLTNFDLTEIKVKDDVPIQLWFKDSANQWWWWRSIGSGWWSLPGAGNIQEVHITSASRNSSDRYSVDDIKVNAR